MMCLTVHSQSILTMLINALAWGGVGALCGDVGGKAQKTAGELSCSGLSDVMSKQPHKQ